MSVGVILLAAGSGQRFGSRVPKQFLSLKNSPLLFHSLSVFERSREINQLVIVAAPDKVKKVQTLLKQKKIRHSWQVVSGGSFRGESVQKGFNSFSVVPDVVLVHDVARPLVTKKIIEDVIQSAQKHGVALAAWPLSDTLKLAYGANMVKKTIPRDHLWLAQTPQGFRRDVAIRCLSRPSKKATDDVSLAEKKGYSVKLVKASPTNIKITYPMDFKIAVALSNL